MNNPNTEIRTYFVDNIGGSIPVFDSRQAAEKVNLCYLILDQNNEREPSDKCTISTIQTLTIEVIQRLPRFGNASSRVILDDATNALYLAFDSIILPSFRVNEKSISDNSVVTYGPNEIINRNIVTLNFKII